MALVWSENFAAGIGTSMLGPYITLETGTISGTSGASPITGSGTLWRSNTISAIANGTYILIGDLPGTRLKCNRFTTNTAGNVAGTLGASYSSNVYYTIRGRNCVPDNNSTATMNGTVNGTTMYSHSWWHEHNANGRPTYRVKTADTDYPYIAWQEWITANLGQGPAGENTIDALDGDDYVITGIHFAGIGGNTEANTTPAGVGNVTSTSGSNVITGVGTNFGTKVRAGDVFTINNQSYTINTVTNATHLTLTTTALETHTTNGNYNVGTSNTWWSSTGGWWDASEGRFKIQIKMTAFTSTFFSEFYFAKIGNIGGNSIDGYVSDYSSNSTPELHIVLFAELWSSNSGSVYEDSSQAMVVSEVDDQWQTFDLRWKCGTVPDNFVGAGVGTISTTAGSNTVTGVGTTFADGVLQVGSLITISGAPGFAFAIATIANNTSLNLTTTVSNTYVANTYTAQSYAVLRDGWIKLYWTKNNTGAPILIYDLQDLDLWLNDNNNFLPMGVSPGISVYNAPTNWLRTLELPSLGGPTTNIELYDDSGEEEGGGSEEANSEGTMTFVGTKQNLIQKNLS